MGGLIALFVLCLFLLIRDWMRERRIKKMAERIEDCLSGNGPMLDVALEEDNLARLQNAISDTQQALERQRELYAQEVDSHEKNDLFHLGPGAFAVRMQCRKCGTHT